MVTPNQIAVLGSMLVDERCVGQVISETEATDYLDADCRVLYLAARSLYNEDKPVDPVTVLGATGRPKDGPLYDLVKRCMEETPTAANVGEYIPLLRQEARLTQLQALGMRMAWAKTLEEARETVAKMEALTVDKPGVTAMTMAEGLELFFVRQKEKPKYLTWGLAELDEKMYLEYGDMAIVGGYPSDGKTAWALAAAWHMGQTDRVGFFSLETSDAKLMDRLVARAALISMGKIKRRELDEADYTTITAMSGRFVKSKLELVPAAHMTASDILAYSKAHRYRVIFIDYVQLIEPEADVRRETKTNQLSETSRRLHVGGQASGITVVALSQLSRATKTGGKRLAPRMDDLRESGQLEQDADTVMLLYRENYALPESRRVLSVEKNKEGTTGQMYLRFDGDTQTFRRHFDQSPPPKRKEPEYKQVEFQELQEPDPDNPFPAGGDLP